MNRFSVVVPIHNEERFLPLSLPSIYRLFPSEVVLLFDRCTDNSVKVAREIASQFRMLSKTLFVDINGECDFRLRFAYLRCRGVELCSFDVVLISASDLILDRKIRNYVDLVGEFGLITFEYKDFPVNWRMLIKRLLARVLPFDWVGGVRLFDRRFTQFEDLEELKSLSSEDTHLAEAIKGQTKTLYVLSDTVHLRPKESFKRHYRRGKLYAQYERSFLLTLASAVCMLRFGLLKGYIHERFRKHN